MALQKATTGYQVPNRRELTEWRLPKQLQDEYRNAEQQAPGLLLCTQFASHLRGRVQYDCAEWEPAFLRQAREFPFLPLLPREASK